MIKTAKKYKHHETIGHDFKGYSTKTQKTEVYFCDSFDSAIGFWMINIGDPEDRKNVSLAAIGRTFHHDYNGCRHQDCRRVWQNHR